MTGQLTTCEETERFKQQHSVETTPQTWIGCDRIGGYDELREYFGEKPAMTRCHIDRSSRFLQLPY